MPGPEQLPRFRPGNAVPAFATETIPAGRFVAISGAKTSQGDYSVALCGAGDQSFGVSEQTSAPDTDPAHSFDRRINCSRRGTIARVEAGDDITAGEPVTSDVDGKAVPASGGDAVLGFACDDCADGKIAEVDLT